MASAQKEIGLSFGGSSLEGRVQLETSKSECNRALIMQALSGGKISLSNISKARDSQTMIRLLQEEDPLLDVLDAGTTMRFLTAYCAVSGKKVTLTGTPRMQKRPIKLLVDALKTLGAKIDYEQEEGYPPIALDGFEQKTRNLQIPGHISSQYISALLMTAPSLSQGLRLELTGQVISRPYIAMTLSLMHHFGIQYQWENQIIEIAPQPYQAAHYQIEADWSGASYWYSMAALAPQADLFLIGLREKSFQGDQAIAAIMAQLGVHTDFQENGIRLTKKEAQAEFAYDFTDCPDLAQTVAVTCAAKGIRAKLTGLQSLRIKETDRIAALQAELGKTGVQVEVEGDHTITIAPQKITAETCHFHTYEDHRMAMAFAPLGLLGNIAFDDRTVVNKSYPSFWEHLEQVGFTTK